MKKETDNAIKDCEGCANQGKLKTEKGIYRWCGKGIINFGKRKCTEKERERITIEEMDCIDRRLRREEEKDLREKGLMKVDGVVRSSGGK